MSFNIQGDYFIAYALIKKKIKLRQSFKIQWNIDDSQKSIGYVQDSILTYNFIYISF